MDLCYHTATFSFCLDLTDPQAKAVPVAIFMAGDAADVRITALVTRSNHPLRDQLDPFSQAVIDMLPQVLRDQVHDVCSADHPSLSDLFTVLCDSFRNSIFIERVSKVATIELAEHSSITDRIEAITAATQGVLRREIFGATAKIDELCKAKSEALPQLDVWTQPSRHRRESAGLVAPT